MNETKIKPVIATMPNAEVILERMNKHDDTGGDIERFHRQFSARIGGQQINQMGVNLSYELLAIELRKQVMATPLIYELLSFDFEDCINAVFVDMPEFAAACIEWRTFIEPHK